LWYADATEFDLLPYLVRGWRKKGRQRKVPTPGKNRKLAACGAICYGSGLFLHHTQPRVTAWGMRYLVQRLLARAKRTGKKIVLVLDKGNPNHAHGLHRDLEMARPHIEVFWLPNYCWNLNLIERLWKHVKGSRIANVLFTSYRRFVQHVEIALVDFARHPDLTFSIVSPMTRTPVRKNLVAHT
jgi:transposase